ncbi:MAG: hypothetical protein AB4062_15680 [Crocosphaera sp.]
MLNFFNAKNTFMAITGGLVSTLIISIPIVAKAEVIFKKYVPNCTIYYSGIPDSVRCREYVVTRDNQNQTYGHHFVFNRSRTKSIMLFSPNFSIPDRTEVMFKITGIMLNNGSKKIMSQGSGRCKFNLYSLNCNYYDFDTEEILNINIKF